MMFFSSPCSIPTRYSGLAALGVLLALTTASGCFQDGARQRGEGQQPVVEAPEQDPSAVAAPTAPDPVAESRQTSGDLDAGPIQFQFEWDGSTTPTSENVRGVDAAAGEAERGLADPDAGPDAN